MRVVLVVNPFSSSVTARARVVIRKALSADHDVSMVEDWSQTMGHAQAIWIDREEGVLRGGADPRGEGMAMGF